MKRFPRVQAVSVALVTLSAVTGPLAAWSQDATQDDSKPAPARTLSGQDEAQAKALKEQIQRLSRSGEFEAALKPAREVLTLCERALGPDHWETADSRLKIQTLETIAKLPEEGRK